MDKVVSLRWFLGIFTALFILFLYGPFIVMGILSFQQGPEGGPQFPIIEWSTYWYQHVFGVAPPSRVAPLPIGEALFGSGLATLPFGNRITVGALSTATASRRLSLRDASSLGAAIWMPGTT